MLHLMDHQESKAHASAAIRSGLSSFLKKYGATPYDVADNARKAAEAVVKRDQEKSKEQVSIPH
jgi:hypothetical protein